MGRLVICISITVVASSLLFVLYKKNIIPRDTFPFENTVKRSGMEASLVLVPDLNHPDTEKSINTSLKNTIAVLQRRAEEAGYTATILAGADRKINLTLGGVIDTLLIRQLFTANQSIGFWETYPVEQAAAAMKRAFDIDNAREMDEADSIKIVANDSLSEDAKALLSGIEQEQPVIRTSENRLFNFSATAYQTGILATVKVSDTLKAGEILRDSSVTAALPKDAELLFGAGLMKENPPQFAVYVIKNPEKQNIPLVGDRDIRTASADLSPDNFVSVSLRLSQAGSLKFESLTRRNVDRMIAITMNDFVLSTPRVIEPVSGGDISISGAFSFDEAKTLSAQLNAGKLPVPLTIGSITYKKLKKPGSLLQDTLVFLSFLMITGLATYLIQKLFKTS
jgi:preprotein translocase subunit SecD